ncbi:MAG TPA: hypothetical protein VHA14_04265 [Bryobacteraceae bacterium]|nr:hypothetical protein [Bryobacteraceae bacterium]
MIAVFALLFLAANNQLTLDKVRAETNPLRRAKAAVEYAAIAERVAEQAGDKGDNALLKASIADMVTAMELARDSFVASGKTPYHDPHTFKGAELQSHEILHRLADLKDKLDVDQRPLLDEPIMKIEKIHDDWFYGIMGRKK